MKFLLYFWVEIIGFIWIKYHFKFAGLLLLKHLNNSISLIRAVSERFLMESDRRIIPLIVETLHKEINISKILLLIGNLNFGCSKEIVKPYMDDINAETRETANYVINDILKDTKCDTMKYFH